MSLKYYKEEFEKYGSLNSIDEAEGQRIATFVSKYFDIPRVQLIFDHKYGVYSWYKTGGHVVFLGANGISKPLAVPTIKIKKGHRNVRMLAHKLAHHLHHYTFNKMVSDYARSWGINTADTTLNGRSKYLDFIKKYVKGQRTHGPEHAMFMGKIVVALIEHGFITVKPTYMLDSEFASLYNTKSL